MYFNNQRTQIQALMKDTTKPTANRGTSSTDNSARSLYRLYTPAPMSVGMAKKNEKSVAALRDKPSNMPPMMVAPLRLVPGIMARHCTKPTMSASRPRMSSTARMRTLDGGLLSAHKIMKPPTMKVVATTQGVNRCALMSLPNNKPKITAGTKPMNTFKTKRCASTW